MVLVRTGTSTMSSLFEQGTGTVHYPFPCQKSERGFSGSGILIIVDVF